MTISHLVTHSDSFHADELLSTVILTRLFPDADIVRSRDAEWITPRADKIIYDVGREFDADAQIFDHHQKPGPMRPDGQPYSSFGLIWAHYGQDYLRNLGVPEQNVGAIHAAFDSEVVLPIDLLDNGAVNPSDAGPLFAAITLPSLIFSLRPVFDDTSESASDQAFHDALPVVRAIIEGQIKHLAATQRANNIVKGAIDTGGADRVLELPSGMPFLDAVQEAGADHLLFVICPRGTDWELSVIPVGPDTFVARADLPSSWAGLTDTALEAASGVQGAKFCHQGRFIAIASEREAILEMAQIACQEVDKNLG